MSKIVIQSENFFGDLLYLLKSAGLWYLGQTKPSLEKYGNRSCTVPWYKQFPSAKTYSCNKMKNQDKEDRYVFGLKAEYRPLL